ncbi:hypothetical protein C8N24_5461 [Solirubrobacter pauli]|uniref:Uncharacterized protein n=1 Tax=Solirubrobacter pauli TaxID=166793 RepID=A0A660L3C3_9ACTN|nr:hypothetical protein C8N24_5461 [Solirubrobacter pauli]
MDGLSRPIWLRLTAAALVLGASFVVVVWALLAALFGSVAVALAVFVAACLMALAVWPVLAGRWARGALVAPQGIAVLAVLGAYVFVALFAAEQVRAGLEERVAHATPNDELAFWTALALGGVLAAVIVAVALPVELTRRVRRLVTGVLAVTGLLGAGATVAIAAAGDPCDGFRFDGSAWRSEDTRERVGEALVRCHTLIGMHRDEVDDLLGGQSSTLGYRSYTLWQGTDAMSFPSYRTLTVTYGDDQRVRSASVGRHHG